MHAHTIANSVATVRDMATGLWVSGIVTSNDNTLVSALRGYL